MSCEGINNADEGEFTCISREWILRNQISLSLPVIVATLTKARHHWFAPQHQKTSSNALLWKLKKRVSEKQKPNHSYWNAFQLQVHFHINQTHANMKIFAQRLILKQRHKVTHFLNNLQTFISICNLITSWEKVLKHSKWCTVLKSLYKCLPPWLNQTFQCLQPLWPNASDH